MNRLQAYRDFLTRKVCFDGGKGFPCTPDEVNPLLLPHQRAMVAWAVRGGCRAIFASFGLGKTLVQFEVCRLMLEKSGGSRALIILPLGVRQEFARDGQMVEIFTRFVRTNEEATEPGFYTTNYESVRDGKIDPTKFDVCTLDEASILRGLGGTKTFREFMALFEHTDNYRFVATATPSPNDYIELLAYAAFLGIMDVGQAKTRFFKRNSEKADKLTLLPHKEEEFWLWVASWALFVQRPSDLGFSDEGYVLPELDIRWHEVPTDHTSAHSELDHNGQGAIFKDTSLGVVSASKEKRDSLDTRISKMLELRSEEPSAHRLIWHDLEAERNAIERAIPGVVSVYGSQNLDEREQAIIDFSDGKIQELAAKPVIAGSGCNFQRHCHWAIFVGIGFKFNDFIQAIYRTQRFLQTKTVRIDLIYTEAERGVRADLERKWRQYEKQLAIMTEIIRKYGLVESAISDQLARSMGVERIEEAGDGWKLVRNDCVEEALSMADESVDLIVTSIPFSMMYEYTPSFNDFGHTDDNDHFWQQMDFLIPELLRVLRPGRVAAIHVKDRIAPGGLTGLGFQTVQPFSDECVAAFRKHGFAFLARKTVVTDVVRENAQTYRLGWSEQCKDGSRMGCGMPEYVLLFRKPQTDRTKGYADLPVVKSKDEYSRARWQLDAHGFTRSNGDRLLLPTELDGLNHEKVYKAFRSHSLTHVYDFENHVEIGEYLAERKMLPTAFMLIPPQSWHPDVWTDIARMRTLNALQSQKGKEMHVCPLQFDIVDRLIVQFSMKGETVWDPFSGIGTVPLRAKELERIGWGCELNAGYWGDGVGYCRRAESKQAQLSLLDVVDLEEAS